MSLSDRLRIDADYIWRKILNHPFINAIYEGSLPLEKFIFYVKQDYNYLIGMMRVLSILASKADYEIAKFALELAHIDATIEMENYVRLLNSLGLTLNEVINEEPMPTNVAYINYLISTCYIGSPLECLVAILPCFWSYAEIAEEKKELLLRNKVEVYVDWARTYLTKEYKDLVYKLRRLIDKLWNGRDYDKLRRIFITASKYEYMFWDAAYREEKWPL